MTGFLLLCGCNGAQKLNGLERPIVVIAVDSATGTVVLQSEGMTVVCETSTYLSLAVITGGYKIGDTLLQCAGSQ